MELKLVEQRLETETEASRKPEDGKLVELPLEMLAGVGGGGGAGLTIP